MTQKSKYDICTSWEDFVYSSTISIFAREGSLDGSFLDVGPSSGLGVLTPDKHERICSECGDFVIPFYE